LVIQWPKRLACSAISLAIAGTLVAGCGSSQSPKAKLLKQMHQMVPNIPDSDIIFDAGTVCTETAAKARHDLLTDSMAAMEGINGLLRQSNVRRYVDRLMQVARSTGYC
jgi:hypothetical protein